jgi:hypothetical protein
VSGVAWRCLDPGARARPSTSLRAYAPHTVSRKTHKGLPDSGRPSCGRSRRPLFRRRRWDLNPRWGFCRTRPRRFRPWLAFRRIPCKRLDRLCCLADRVAPGALQHSRVARRNRRRQEPEGDRTGQGDLVRGAPGSRPCYHRGDQVGSRLIRRRGPLGSGPGRTGPRGGLRASSRSDRVP